jgi:hypothetical protein
VPWLATALVCGVAAVARWRLAELADWGIDESANLWLGTLILDGNAPTVGLSSSRGVLNLAGAPLLAAPLARLPDLLAVSRALSLLQLAALLVLGIVLARGPRTWLAVAALAFSPAIVLAAPNLWNQYLALPINAAITTVLLVLAERPDARRAGRFDLAALLVVLLLMQPAVHLAGFSDLAAQGLLALAVFGIRPPRQRGIALELGIALALAGAYVLYGPWLMRVGGLGFNAALAVAFVAGVVAMLAVALTEGRLTALARRASAAPLLGWCVPLVLAASIVAVPIAFRGAQTGEQLLWSDWWGVVLLAGSIACAALTAPALPGVIADCRARRPLGAILQTWFPNRESGAALLLANAGLLLVARAVLVPEAFVPSGRPDLLLPLLPTLLAPSILLAVTTPRPMLRAWSAGAALIAAAAVAGFAAVGPRPSWWAHPQFLPAREIGAVVDWIAAQPDALDADGRLDVAYDLGRESLVEIACSPASSWYTTSRPFDWLFRRRHGLRDRREGDCRRAGGGRYVVTYRAAPAPADRRLRLALPHLAVWQGVAERAE